MTVLTDVGRIFFERRGQPGKTRTFLRTNSTAWRHFDQLGTSTVYCDTCDNRVSHSALAPHIAGNIVASVEKHRIGTAWIDGMPHAKWCDGTETAE